MQNGSSNSRRTSQSTASFHQRVGSNGTPIMTPTSQHFYPRQHQKSLGKNSLLVAIMTKFGGHGDVNEPSNDVNGINNDEYSQASGSEFGGTDSRFNSINNRANMHDDEMRMSEADKQAELEQEITNREVVVMTIPKRRLTVAQNYHNKDNIFNKLAMVKVKTQGREAFRNTIEDSRTESFTSVDDSDDDKLQNIPDVSDSDEPTLRRSTRSRKQVSFQQMLPTAEAIPLRGEIPCVNSSTSTKSNISATKYQFSLSSLLREKKHRNKSLCELDDPFDVYDRTEISAAVLNEDIKREHLQQIFKEDESDDLDQQMEFFIDNNTELPSPALQTTMQALEDPAFALIAGSSSDDEKLKYILCQNWIPQQYELGMKLPPETISWLLELICYEEDTIIIEAASHTLTRLAEISGRYSINTTVEPTSVPFSSIYQILSAFGAPSQMLGYQCFLEEQAKSSLPFEPSSSKFPYIDNLQVLLKTIVPLIKNRLLSFSDYEEIRRAIYVVLRMSLDRRISLISSYIERTVDSFLDLFKDDDWSSQAKLICEDIVSACGTIAKFNAVTLDNLPISIRGRLLRRLLAFKSLFTLSSKTWDLNTIDITKPLSLEPLLSFFNGEEPMFKIQINTNYNELYYKVLLLNFAIDDEKQMTSEK
ncbi:9712_t:CDS:10, partial [Racocetra persica]